MTLLRRINLQNASDVVINPATYDAQTDGTQKTQIVTEGAAVDSNNPLAVDGDSVYAKDVNVSGSDIGTFTGTITDIFDSLSTTITSTGHVSPAYFELKLTRPVNNNSLKICSPSGKNFSNVKVILKDASGGTVDTVDYSTDNTDRTRHEYSWRQTAWCTIRVEFHTTDDVDINWVFLEKSRLTHGIKKFHSLNNSTSTALPGDTGGSDHIFTGEWERAVDYPGAIIIINTDQDSGASGFVIEFSNDGGTTVLHRHTDTIYANDPNGHHYPTAIDTDYFRVLYTNGAVAQTTFHLSTTLMPSMPEDAHAHGVEYAIDADHPAPIRRVVIVGKNASGTYSNVALTNGNNIRVSLEELESAISVNSNSQLRTTLFDSSGNEVAFLSLGGVYTIGVTQRPIETFSVSMSIEALAASTDYILVDLSDTTNFPHTNTGHIHLTGVHLDLNPDTSFRGDVEIGYLKNVDATDGDFVMVKEYHQDLQAVPEHEFEPLFPAEIICTDAYHLGPVTANDTAFQTDVNLTSPAGTSPSGDGDLVMRVTRTAGTIDIGVTIQYRTEA